MKLYTQLSWYLLNRSSAAPTQSSQVAFNKAHNMLSFLPVATRFL
jgi:hypothetical protein